MSDARARLWDKANSMHSAWLRKYGEAPSHAALTLAMAHGEFETRLGDSWPGEHNVGACQERTLSVEEKVCLANAKLWPATAIVPAAKSALEAAGLRSAGLHCDSSPVHGPYFVFFRVFGSDVEGDEFFLHVAIDQRPSAGAVLLLGGPVYEYAARLYATKYFEGGHDPHTQEGRDANVADYANALTRTRATIEAALVGWTPGAVPLDSAAVMAALAELGYDGDEAVRAFQAAHPPLVVDGILGPQTMAAVEKVLQESCAPSTV
jgi:hypothetical protein